MKEIIWINGRVLQKRKAHLSVFDRSFLYGDGLFETMRAYRGKPFRLDRHIDRLFSSAKVLRIKPPYGKRFLKKAVSKISSPFKSGGGYVRVAITRGEGAPGLDPGFSGRPNVVMWARAFEGFPADFYAKGVKAVLSSVRRNNHSPVANIKSNNYLGNILAYSEAMDKGADEAIMLNADGFVAEATTSNVFILKRGVLATPRVKDGILPGITREAVMRLASRIGLKAVERRIRPFELKNADEVFLTNSMIEVRAVTGIGSRRVSSGRPGPVAGLLHRCYRELVEKELKIR